MKLIDMVQVWLTVQAQNGDLERFFPHKRRMEDRLKAAFPNSYSA